MKYISAHSYVVGQPKKAKTGIMVCMYFCFYGLGRFLIEGLRTDSLYLFPGLRVSPVSYTHLDVYKRQILLLQTEWTA